jgi:hypothetical protein
MNVAVAPRVAETAAAPNSNAVGRAQVWLWLGFAFFLAGVGIGTGWDRRWHASHPFEDFFSPPHLFIYTNVILASACVVYVTFNRRLRSVFGPGETLQPFPFKIPPALMLLGAGFVVLGLGGVFDGIWHTLFGLDETNWSLPHSMLGHGILLVALGFVSVNLALQKPLAWVARGVLAWVALNVAIDLIGGPILRNPPPAGLQAIAQIPVLAADAAFQHTTRIYLAWHLDRTNWLYLPMIAFTVGLGVRLAQRLTGPRDRWLVLLSAVPLALAAFSDELGSGWARLLLAPPFLPAALGYAGMRRIGVRGPCAWLGAGWGAAVVSLVVTKEPLVALLSGPLALVGAYVGERLLAVVDHPSRRAVIATNFAVGILIPVLGGALDLYWRMNTP